MKATPSQQTPSGGSDHRLVRPLKCFACPREFTDTDKLAMHEQNDHPHEYHAAMVREMYGCSDGYEFEPNI